MKRDYNKERKRRAKSSHERSFSEKRARKKKEIREEEKTSAICPRQRRK